MRSTLSQALDDSISRIPTALNLISTDPRCVTYVNMSTLRLMARGHWWGLVPRYKVSVTKQLFTLPPQFANIEKIAACQWPLGLRNSWYEFNASGVGLSGDPTASCPNSNLSSQAILRGTACTNKDIVGTNSKVKIICDVLEDVGATVLLLGYDSSGNWLRTKQGGVWKDGEVITLAQTPGTISTNVFSRLTDIQKPVTNGQLWIYEQDGATNPQISHLEYWEVNPQYQRFLLPVLDGNATQIDLIGKLAYRLVTNPTDYLLIGNLEALRLGCLAVKAEEEHDYAAAAIYMNGGRTKAGVIEGAVQVLESELQHYMGDGATPSIEVVSAFGMEGVESLL